ncbi:hypothetical protein BJ980_001635 [Nocardioides daedukensis]|uniref:Uncharacterized protein n=1 Tax=Nocardioides daedukensis TaxID=634462 RepID=A0A7Y9S1E4_9ACTN|nr:hypothetical protein [Nocardioides daedukensis]NYG58712.1 hypothetical protein [Nocardioides daedukensis]
MSTHLPAPIQVRELLTELLGRDVELSPGAPLAPGPATPATIASYVDDSLQLAALVVCDLPLSAHAGAAIGLVPPDQALAAIADGALTDALAENLYEVLNIAAAMFNVDGAPHVRLHALAPAGGPIDPQLMARALTLGRREDAALTISGYGAGRLSIVLV